MNEQSSTSLWVERKPSRIRWLCGTWPSCFLCCPLCRLQYSFALLSDSSEFFEHCLQHGLHRYHGSSTNGACHRRSYGPLDGASAQLAGVLVGILYGRDGIYGWQFFCLFIGLAIGAANAVSVTRLASIPSLRLLVC